MTLFSFEVPIAHLKDFEPYQDFTFALAFLLDESSEYEAYIKRKCKEDLVYLDNGFNETLIPASPQRMQDLYKKYQPTAVVSPDADDWDYMMTEAAYKSLRSRIGSDHIIGVYRSDVEREIFQDAYQTAISYWWIDLVSQHNLQDTHFLGLSKLDLVVKCKPYSLDTSQMVKMALRGQRFEDWAQRGVLEKHITRESGARIGQRLQRARDYFNYRMSYSELELAAHNMQALKAYVNGEGRGQVQSNDREVGSGIRQPNLHNDVGVGSEISTPPSV